MGNARLGDVVREVLTEVVRYRPDMSYEPSPMNPVGTALCLTACFLCQDAVAGAAQQAAAGTPESTVIVMLGTGTPRPLPDVWGPATAVVVGKRVFLVDAGVGVERRLAAAGLPSTVSPPSSSPISTAITCWGWPISSSPRGSSGARSLSRSTGRTDSPR